MRSNNTNRAFTSRLGAAAFAALLCVATPGFADTPKANDITPALIQAGLKVEGLRGVEVGGIVVLRGRTDDRATAEQATAIAQGLGYQRVANLIQVMEPADDVAIERIAERRLGQTRGLDGCQIYVDSDNGVVKLGGTVRYELQKDVAIQIVRNIAGVKSVQSLLKK